MTIDRLSPSAASHAAAIGSALTTSQAAGIAARTVAVEVLGRLGTQFLDAAAGRSGSEAQPYPLGELADILGRQLGASPLETVELEGALGALAGALSADMAALADGRTLDRLDAALADLGDAQLPAGASTVARHLEDLASHVAQAR